MNFILGNASMMMTINKVGYTFGMLMYILGKQARNMAIIYAIACLYIAGCDIIILLFRVIFSSLFLQNRRSLKREVEKYSQNSEANTKKRIQVLKIVIYGVLATHLGKFLFEESLNGTLD